MLTTLTSDMASRRAVWSAYRRSLETTTDPTEVDVNLRLHGGVHPLRMRLCDIYTLAEILHQRQYDVRSPVPASPRIVDAGANIGVSAVWFLAQYPGAKLLAIEPEPENFRLLKANLGNRQGATLEQAALGASNGQVTLHLASHDAMHSVVASDDQSGRSVTVPAVRLDESMKRHGFDRIDLLKLDVEGSELDALEGLGPRIRDVGVIIGEMHERMVDPEKFYRFLGEHGFRTVHRTYFGDGRSEGVHGFEVVREGT